jgi:hypothetical protein
MGLWVDAFFEASTQSSKSAKFSFVFKGLRRCVDAWMPIRRSAHLRAARLPLPLLALGAMPAPAGLGPEIKECTPRWCGRRVPVIVRLGRPVGARSAGWAARTLPALVM